MDLSGSLAGAGQPLLALFGDLAIALFIGALVGTERERHSVPDHNVVLGLRTFALISLAGATFAQLSIATGNPMFEVGLFAVVLLVLGTRAMTRKVEASGMATDIAAVFVFVLGGVVVFQSRELAVALGVVTTSLLALKEPLHKAVQSLGQEDIYAALKLLFATFIVLPVLPREAIDPWGALKPYSLWWLVILIAGLSLVGYMGTRFYGAGKGAVLTGFFGGLVSSTAVSLEFSRRSREPNAASAALGVGILVAWSTMAVRVVIEVAVVDARLLPSVALPMAAFLLPAMVAGLIAWRRVSAEEQTVAVANPFHLGAAIRIGLAFAVVLLGVRLAQLYLPDGGLYVVAALAGGSDVDAITLSLAQEAASGALGQTQASTAIVLAAAANTVVKWGLALWLGNNTVRLICSAAAAAMLLGAGLAIWPL